jgi:hypothetical protein
MRSETVREPRGRGTSSVGSRYRATASEDMTVNTSVCVTVNCKLWLPVVLKCAVNSITNPNPVYSHSYKLQYSKVRLQLHVNLKVNSAGYDQNKIHI